MALLADLRYFQHCVPATQASPNGQQPKIDSFYHKVFSKGPRLHISTVFD